MVGRATAAMQERALSFFRRVGLDARPNPQGGDWDVSVPLFSDRAVGMFLFFARVIEPVSVVCCMSLCFCDRIVINETTLPMTFTCQIWSQSVLIGEWTETGSARAGGGGGLDPVSVRVRWTPREMEVMSDRMTRIKNFVRHAFSRVMAVDYDMPRLDGEERKEGDNEALPAASPARRRRTRGRDHQTARVAHDPRAAELRYVRSFFSLVDRCGQACALLGRLAAAVPSVNVTLPALPARLREFARNATFVQLVTEQSGQVSWPCSVCVMYVSVPIPALPSNFAGGGDEAHG